MLEMFKERKEKKTIGTVVLGHGTIGGEER